MEFCEYGTWYFFFFYLKNFWEESLPDLDHLEVLEVVEGGDGAPDGVAGPAVELDNVNAGLEFAAADVIKRFLSSSLTLRIHKLECSPREY
jgi:hypothetical protein